MKFSTLILSASCLALVACGGGEPETDVTADTASAPSSASASASTSSDASPEQTASGFTQLAWEDLMPVGEDEVLAELYAEFYADLEARMIASEAPLSSMLEQAEDIDVTAIAEGSDMDTMEQIGTFNVVEDLDGMKVRIPGYIVPLDFSADAQHSQFLLVPYFGACLHSPPPPPNQIVFVTSNPPASIPDIYEPVWLEGEMKTGRFDTEMANSAYELRLSSLELYEY